MTNLIGKLSSLILLICLSSVCYEANATHIVGGDLTYRHIGNNYYEVTLTVRRDCNNGDDEAPFDDPAHIGLFDEFGNILTGFGVGGQLVIPFSGDDTITNTLDANCGFVNSPVCVHQAIYTDTIFLWRTSDITFSYQRCCRNSTLNNIVNPLETGATRYVTLTKQGLEEQNSSPSFNDWPDIYICANTQLNFDHSATDIDGDELRYRLCTPSNGATFDDPIPVPPSKPPYGEIEWNNGYGLDNMLGSGTPLTIDESTGQVTAVPGTVGQFLVGICVEEYRNGVLLSTVRRDFEYNVRACEDMPLASFEGPTGVCDSLSATFTNTSENLDNYTWLFDYPNDVPSSTEAGNSVTHTYDQPGTYTVRLVGVNSDNGCESIFEQTVEIYGNSIITDFNVEIAACRNDSVQLTISDASIDNFEGCEINEWWWLIEYGSEVIVNSNEVLNIWVPESQTDVSISLRAISSCGCESVILRTEEINAVTENEVGFEIVECLDGGAVRVRFFDATDANAESWSWVIDVNGDVVTSTESSVTVDLPEAGDYSVILNSVMANGCRGEFAENINIGLSDLASYAGSVVECISEDVIRIRLTDNSPQVGGESPSSSSWVITINGEPQIFEGSEIEIDVNVNDDINVDLTSTYPGGCQASYSDTLDVYGIMGGTFDYTATTDDCGMTGVNITFTNITDGPFEGAGITSTDWEFIYDGGTQTASGSTVSMEFPLVGAVMVRMIVTFDNGCVISYTKEFDIQNVSLAFFAEPLNVCSGNGAFLLSNPNPEWDYTWSPTEGLDFSNGNSNPIVNVTEATTYNVTVTNGICTVESSVDVAVSNFLDLTITGNTEICGGGDINLMVTGGTAAGYEWSFDENFEEIVSVTDVVNIPFSGDSQTFYVRTLTSGDCESEVESVTVNNGNVSIDFLSNPIITCLDAPAAIVANPNENWTYEWSPTAGLDFTNGNSNPTALPDASTTYSVTVTNGECSVEESIFVERLDLVDLEISGDTDPNSCDGVADLVVTGATDAQYEWSTSADFDQIIAVGNSISVGIPGRSATFYVRVRSENSCASEVESITLFDRSIDLTSTPNPAEICDNDTIQVTLTNNDADQDVVIVWDANDHILSGLDGNTVSVTSIEGDGDSFDITYTATNQYGCSVNGTVTVGTDPSGTPLVISSIDAYCSEYRVCINSNAEDGAITWDFNDPNNVDDRMTGGSPCYTYSEPGDYEVKAGGNMPGCMVIDTTFSITIPNIVNINGDDSIEYCAGENVTISATTDGSPSDVVWTDNNGNQIGTGPSITIDPSGISSVSATLSGVQCNEPSTVSLVELGLNVRLDDETAAAGVCTGQEVIISVVNTVAGDFSYVWSPADCIVNGQGTANPTIASAVSKDLTVVVTDNTTGCTETLIGQYVVTDVDFGFELDPSAIINLGESTIICIDDIESGGTVLWNTGETTECITVAPNTTTEYTATVTSSNGCTAMNSVSIEVIESCEFDFDLDPNDIIFLGESTIICIDDFENGSSVVWNTGETTECITVSPLETSDFTATVTTAAGCEDTESVTITVRQPNCDESDIFVPSGFSPNGDNTNDIFRVRSNFIKSLSLVVYDRWGEEIYNSTDIDGGWNGQFNNTGDLLTPDVYAYCARVICTNDEEYVAIGNVTLVR